MIPALLSLSIPVLAVAFLIGALAAHRRGRLPPRFWRLFALGCALGCVWEVGFGLLGPAYTDEPLFVWIHPGGMPIVPQPADSGGLMMVLGTAAVCIWDGAIFVAGLLIVDRICRAPTLARFRWTELAVLLAWGQAQSFAIEMIAIAGGLWGYQPRGYNPALFPFMDGWITLAPQAVWLIAYPIFYGAALRWRG